MQIAEVLRSTALRAHEKGLELVYEVSDGVPDQLIGDPGRLRQIILNLVGNAIKFTNQGEVALRIAVEQAAPESLVLHFLIEDTGLGIPADRVDQVFEAFAQADGSTARLYGGTGLGLSISRQLVSMMGGKIWFRSEVGKGTCCHFTAHFGLPQVEPEPAENGERNLDEIYALIVDDNPTNRRLVEAILTRRGIKHQSVDCGEAALDILDRQTFDIVLSDFQMPRMDGWELTRRIRQRFPEPALKIAILTSMETSAVSAALLP